ncbi:hypothetical protein DAPPUDRAFT_301266 [Daphnia pulex]|uniref:Uncharacterized protein n=1 Tax=Daphnia pulex TaxID=6669 RepID=E9HHU1_DAPPU|nr:hypothetical protein DAPPUDRAFT_301266 [Daphnia pulex]|eukprot:EFX68690.1 hypothetical protein DAPPUDRAFT_301266 [Daphnia pulex]
MTLSIRQLKRLFMSAMTYWFRQVDLIKIKCELFLLFFNDFFLIISIKDFFLVRLVFFSFFWSFACADFYSKCKKACAPTSSYDCDFIFYCCSHFQACF